MLRCAPPRPIDGGHTGQGRGSGHTGPDNLHLILQSRNHFAVPTDYGYLARRMMSLGQLARAMSLAAAVLGVSSQFEVYGLLFEDSGQGEQVREALADAPEADPLNRQARYSSVRSHLGALSRVEASEDIREIAAELSAPLRP